MSQPVIPKDGTASSMMWDACQGFGSTMVTCSCGINWQDEDFDYESDDYEDCETFYFVELDGRHFVSECDGCKTNLKKYEDWIWHNRDAIRDYFKIRINQELKWAEQEKLLNTIAGIK